MRRIGLAVVLAFTLFVALLAAKAEQTSKIPRIGYLSASSTSASGHLLKAFTEGLRDLGWTEGLNIVVETRWAEGHYDRLTGQAAELVKLNVDVIVASPTEAIRAAQRATRSIPIVMATGGDPVALGLVASLARPGGNITGMTSVATELIAKRLEFLKVIAPAMVLLHWGCGGQRLRSTDASRRPSEWRTILTPASGTPGRINRVLRVMLREVRRAGWFN
jgi:putative ABC transport system substrate-binding protein